MSSQFFANHRKLVLVLLISILAPVSALMAQDSGDDEKMATLADEASRLLVRIDKRVVEIREWAELEEQAQGSDLHAVELELADKRLQLLADIRKLAGNVVEQEAQGLAPGEARTRIDSMMREITPHIREHLEEIGASMAELRIRRDEASADELLELEGLVELESDWNNRLTRSYLEHILAMEALGLDGAEDRAWLTDLVTKRAEFCARRIDLARETTARLEDQLELTPDNTNLMAEIAATEQRVQANVEILRTAVVVMQAFDLDTTVHEQEIAQSSGDISDLLREGVAVGLLSQGFDVARQWTADNLSRILLKVGIFLAILLAFRLVAGVIRRVTIRSLASSKIHISRLLQEMITSMIRRTIMILGVLVALSQLGVRVAPVLAGLGVAGFVIGFALQDVLSNFASGVMILFYRPFDIDDVVEVAGVSGSVKMMTLVSTTILTFDHQTLVVPNTKIWGDVIKNVTAQKRRRVDLTFGIAYESDIARAEQVLHEIVTSHPKVQEDPAPTIRLHNLGESSLDFIVRPWVETADYWDVYWDVIREVKLRFDREGINIPYPQRDVHLYEQKAATA